MPKQIEFSIILPTYNRCYILWRAIRSVIRQTYPFWELIIVDDGSTDNTEKLVKQFTDPRVKYFKLPKNKGVTKARNFGLKKAANDFIAYIDSDNQWYEDFLEVMSETFKKYPKKVLVFSKKNYRLKIKDERGREKYLHDEWRRHEKFFDLQRLWHRKIIIDTNAMCHKKSILKKVGKWDEKINFWEDWELALRVSKKYPDGMMFINRTLLDYEQLIDWRQKNKILKKWDSAEKYIFEKHKNHPLMKGQNWYPPSYKNRSTLGIVEFLKSKKE